MIKEKIFKIKCDLTGIGKDSKNPFLKNEYVSLNKLLDTVNPIFQSNRILMEQSSDYAGDNFVKLTTRLTCLDDNDTIESSVAFHAGGKAQESAGALTYMRRYSLITLLGLKAEDDDGNEASGKVSGAKSKADLVKEEFGGDVVGSNSKKSAIIEKMKKFPEQLKEVLKQEDLSFDQIVDFAESCAWDHQAMMLDKGLI